MSDAAPCKCCGHSVPLVTSTASALPELELETRLRGGDHGRDKSMSNQPNGRHFNGDWAVFFLLGCIFAYVNLLMFRP